ncbi:hypothetical protein LTR85_000265 [Meristemomyces frigidus]|nr:hypothetical protein LTR85_000265 [Meristemomyces frigidus]
MSAAEELPSFFRRNGLHTQDAKTCYAFAAERFPSQSKQSSAQQGGCSFTLVAEELGCERVDRATEQDDAADDKTIIQFRLLKHAIPVNMAQAASRIYSPLAPKTRELGQITVGNGVFLQACAMSCIPGERFSDLQPRTPDLDASTLERYKVFLRHVSTFFAKNWHAGQKYSPALPAFTGRVGRSLLFRLGSLERHLPSEALRQRARQTRDAVAAGALDLVPVVLTHGDFIPSNIHVDKVCWTVKGFVDWAEAEYLSTGNCLYGIEHLLGYMEVEDARGPRFVYYKQAEQLRKAFWTAYEQQVPELAESEIRASMMLARDVGIFLWHGFAWDGGNIDRVVNPEDDAEELAYLEAFLGLDSALARHDSVMGGYSPSLSV